MNPEETTTIPADPIQDERDVVDRLRAHVEAASAATNLEEAARALALSTRTLQRALARRGTSFRTEQARGRLRAAEAMLLGGNEKIAAIARTVGCASVAHFTQLFRKSTGERPSEFRARRRPPKAC